MSKVEEWQARFRASSVKVGFSLNLTKPMLQFLCATADDVQWDRMLYFQSMGQGMPECSLATAASLVKRGLIERVPAEILKLHPNRKNGADWETVCQSSHYKLTPPGIVLVELIKLAGLFEEADMAIAKKARKA